MTTLQAINAILSYCGQRPVAATDSGSYTVAGNAETVLNESSRRIQGRGWFFNTRRNVELTPDGSDNIAIPTGALSVSVVRDYGARRITFINGLLFDVENNTDEFDDALHVDYVFLADTDEIPDIILDYIIADAAVEYNARFVKNVLIDAHLRDRRDRAKTLAEQLNGDEERPNIFATAEHRRLRGRREWPELNSPPH